MVEINDKQQKVMGAMNVKAVTIIMTFNYFYLENQFINSQLRDCCKIRIMKPKWSEQNPGVMSAMHKVWFAISGHFQG